MFLVSVFCSGCFSSLPFRHSPPEATVAAHGAQALSILAVEATCAANCCAGRLGRLGHAGALAVADARLGVEVAVGAALGGQALCILAVEAR